MFKKLLFCISFLSANQAGCNWVELNSQKMGGGKIKSQESNEKSHKMSILQRINYKTVLIAGVVAPGLLFLWQKSKSTKPDNPPNIVPTANNLFRGATGSFPNNSASGASSNDTTSSSPHTPPEKNIVTTNLVPFSEIPHHTSIDAAVVPLRTKKISLRKSFWGNTLKEEESAKEYRCLDEISIPADLWGNIPKEYNSLQEILTKKYDDGQTIWANGQSVNLKNPSGRIIASGKLVGIFPKACRMKCMIYLPHIKTDVCEKSENTKLDEHNTIAKNRKITEGYTIVMGDVSDLATVD